MTHAASVSPSDRVVLRPGDFAWRVPDRGGAAAPLPHTGVAANPSAVARAALATAVLACEHVGALRLWTAARARRGWLGQRTEPRLVLRVRLTATAVSWPAGSLEARLLAALPVRRGTRARGVPLREAVAASGACGGAAAVLRHALDAMAARGVDAGHAVPCAPALDAVHSLLDGVQATRPALWAALEHELWLALHETRAAPAR